MSLEKMTRRIATDFYMSEVKKYIKNNLVVESDGEEFIFSPLCRPNLISFTVIGETYNTTKIFDVNVDTLEIKVVWEEINH